MNSVRTLSGIVALVAALGIQGAPAQPTRGSLFIIGGGDRSPEMMREFVDLAGGVDNARIVIIPNASGDADTACIDMAAEFRELGVRKSVECLLLTRDEASNPEAAKRLDGATAVYFTGGDQVRVTKALVGTPVQKKLKEMYRAGLVLGGTSAGAALMSEVMITGDERQNRDTVHNFFRIQKDNVVTVEGMGFVTNAIIDQHFVVRKRHNRLISVVLEHPALIGIGIDEATAIIIRPGEVFDVIGNGNVIVYDATKSDGVRAVQKGTLAAHNMKMDVLVAGDRYDMTGRRVVDRETPR